MIKKLLFTITVVFVICTTLFSQPINITVNPPIGKVAQCPNSTPIITCTYISGTGSSVVNGNLVCTDPCGTTILQIEIDNVKWNQGPDINWIHGVVFGGSSTAFTFLSSDLAPANWFLGAGCTGACVTGGQIAGGLGWYFRGGGQSCCPSGPTTPNPCDNWGDGSFSCNGAIFHVKYTVQLCNSALKGIPLYTDLYLYSDGNTGCWSQPDVTSNILSFTIPNVACPTLYNPLPTATPRLKTCTPSLNYTTTLSGGCGNSNTITWWTASVGGTQVGTGSPFVYDPPGTACPQGTLYAACCPTGNTCANRRAFAVPGACAAALTIDNVAITNPACPSQCGDITATTVSGASGIVTYTLMPDNITNTTGVFTCVTGVNHTLTATDAAGCSASSSVVFTIPVCGFPITAPISYCLNAPAVPLTATLSGTGTNLQWYTALTGGSPLAGAPTPSTATVGPTTYYVTQMNGGVESTPRTPLVVTVVALPATPTITSVAANCTAAGTSTISNYNAANTYTFTPSGPTATATGLVTGMVVGTSYTVTSGNGTCTSAASAPFSNAAMLVTPVVPNIASVAPTCAVPGTSTISNYNAANTYTFTPTGPIASATGLVTGMVIGTSYTVTSGNATCTSLASASFNNAATLVTPAIPTIVSVAPTCTVPGTSTISNYNAANTYAFTPTGPTASATGLLTGMVVGTNYTVTSGNGTCTSAASASFSNAATLVTPAIPSIASVAPTCAVPGTSTISNYNAANTYTFTPTGPTATATGLITGMVVGTSYTVTSGNATCTSLASASFNNAATLVTPAIPTIVSVAPTCTVPGTSTISNYNAANTYTFTPTGPTATATGLVNGMVIGTSYTVTSGNATCTSLASTSFSNAAILATPAVPTIISVVATCTSDGTSTISNYNATNTYTFTPTGPTATATGLVTGMILGTSYTVTSGNATCTSVASPSFSNAAMFAVPAIPTITSVAPTCTSNGTSTISNYLATNTYTFSPSGPIATATGLITGMTIGTIYSVVSGIGVCTSASSATFSNAVMLTTPAVPTIASVAPTCAVSGTSTISNYNASNTYTFTPTGPTASATGLVTGMVIGTSYTVTSGNATCTSLASASFSNAATLVTPAIPTIVSVAPTCTGDGTSMISNYNAANTYTFTPTGPTATATGLVTGMVVGTSYTVTAGLGICTSASSATFSNAVMLTTPAVPTIASVAPTCAVPGTSTISNYNAANTYTFTPTGPTASATGLVTGMVIGTSYTVTSGNATCTSLASASFSNAATLVTPAIPTIVSVAPTCASNGTSTISNYNAANTYTFTPTGPTATATGLVTGMVVGTSYTVTAGLGICTSASSATFSNAVMLTTPAVPTIASIAPTCAVPGTSTISNYNATNTYTFTPTGPTASATGLITGMVIGTSYTVTSGNATCTSLASALFSNAATLVTPAIPTITSVAPTCASNGTSTISNYNAANTYTFTPTGPTATATGLVTGMVVGTSYTVTAGLGICTSASSATFSNAVMLTTPAVPTIASVAPTCAVPGTSTISNYNAANTYTFTPTGPTASATGLITGMVIGTSYTVTSGNATCTSLASALFSNAATLVTPAIPTITSVAPTCASNGTSTISNYNAANTYTFTPTGPTATATGLVTGMVVGTSYTVTAGLGICTSASSATFSNAVMLTTPAVPTIASVAPTCAVPGTSTISNYNAANTYTFTPTGPTASATGLITGMVIGTSYTVTSGNATCTSLASALFSNAATLVTPAIPTITSVAPTCASNGTSTISNYNAANTYTFTPTGPTATATGLVTGMVVGTSYTVTAGLGICTSASSATFSNAVMLTTPAVPTIASVAPTCAVPGTSTISNYNAANTYTFTPIGPTASATGLVTGMVIGTSYTVTSGNATCTSVASASFSNAATLVTPAIPTIVSVAPTCTGDGTSTISNYNAANTYTFTPTGPTATATGLVTGMVVGTSYTVTAGLGICTSASSATFSNAVMLTTPAVPTIASVAPTCAVPGTSTISNYNAANTYTFTPIGPTASATGLVTGMVIGTSYTVTSGNATCTSVASASFSNAATLVTPAIPTIVSVAPTCTGDGTSTISNYNAANTYTFTPTGPTATATGLVTGMVVGTSYTVTAGLGICTSASSATFSNAVMLITPAVPVVTTPLTYCQNATASALTAIGTNLLWYTVPTGGTGSSTAPIPSSANAGTTLYYVSQTASTCEGPRAVITVNITATPLAPIVTSPITYCPGDPSLQLTASGTNLLWYTTATGGVGNTLAPTPSTAAAGTFTYYVSQSTNVLPTLSCEGPRAAIVVNVNNNNLTVNIGTDTTICEGESVKFTPTVLPSALSYEWRAIGVPNNTIDVKNSKDVTVNPVDNAQYILKATNGGCFTEDTVNVFVRWKPIMDAGANKAICLNDSILIKGNLTHFNSNKIDFAWTPTDSLTSPTSLQTMVHPTQSTWYTITATTTKADYGCDFTAISKVKVVVQPVIKAFAGNDTIAVKGVPHQLHGTGGVNYTWTSASGISIVNPFNQNAFATLNNDANFYLKVTDAIGCTGYDSIFVKVYEGPTYYVPTAFTPNGDGLNDIFRAIPVGISNTVYFRVFNRYGNLIFETTQWLKGWDGTFSGKPQPMGTYVWMVSGTDRNYKKVEMKGTVNLIR
jgi:gliding motility-associated-like protein